MGIKMFAPENIEEAAVLMDAGGGKVLAGGTDLIIELHKGQTVPEYIVDIGEIPELKQIVVEGTSIRLGSMVTFAQLIENDFIRQNVPSLWEAASKMGATQIQNRATIGGNICNAAPAADSIPVFMSLQAEGLVCGANGRRTVAVKELVTGRGKNSLERGEILEAVIFGRPGANSGCGFAKLGKRNALAISTISCAVKLEETEGSITGISVYTGSLGVKAEEEVRTEAYIMGKRLAELDLDEAAEILSKEVEERLGGRASIVYKKEAVKGIFKEAAQKAIDHLRDMKGGVLQ